MINANSSLIADLELIANIHVVVAVGAGADDTRNTHVSGAARHRHAGYHVGLRNILLQESLDRWVNAGGIDDVRISVVGELRPTVRRIVNIHATLAEVTADFLRRRNCVDHGVRHGVTEAFVINEEEGAIANDGAAE